MDTPDLFSKEHLLIPLRSTRKPHSFHWNITSSPRLEPMRFETCSIQHFGMRLIRIAEQIRIQGELAPRGYGEMVSSATITEENTVPSADTMLNILTSDLGKLLVRQKPVVESAMRRRK